MRKFEINTVADVNNFFDWLVKDVGANLHPDDPFDLYVNSHTGERTFSDDDAAYYDSVMDKCFDVCDKNNVDIYTIGLNTLMSFI